MGGSTVPQFTAPYLQRLPPPLLPACGPANFYFWSGCCKAAVTGPGGRTRDQLMKVTACAPELHVPAQTSPSLPATGPRFSHGQQRDSAGPCCCQCLPHSDSSLAFNNTRPGHDNSTTTPGPAVASQDNNTTTVREEQDWSDQIVRTLPGYAATLLVQ